MQNRHAYRMLLEYDGRGFCGWQVQDARKAGRPSVQAVIEEALATLCGAPTATLVAGRTDAGVHAVGQVAAFTTAAAADPVAARRALNGLCRPHPVAVLDLQACPAAFDPRRDALAKHYRYRVLNREPPSPLRAGVSWHIRRPLDAAALHGLAQPLVGTHDFAAFRASGCTASTTTRTLVRLDVTRQGDEVVFDFEGEGFLRHMVRIIVGTLIDIGLERLPAAALQEALAARNRTRGGRTAPAHGLALVAVRYPPGITWAV